MTSIKIPLETAIIPCDTGIFEPRACGKRSVNAISDYAPGRNEHPQSGRRRREETCSHRHSSIRSTGSRALAVARGGRMARRGDMETTVPDRHQRLGESTETESSDRSSQGSPVSHHQQQTEQTPAHTLGSLWGHSSAAFNRAPTPKDQSSESRRIRIGRPPKKRDASELCDPAPKPRRVRKASHLARRVSRLRCRRKEVGPCSRHSLITGREGVAGEPDRPDGVRCGAHEAPHSVQRREPHARGGPSGQRYPSGRRLLAGDHTRVAPGLALQADGETFILERLCAPSADGGCAHSARP